MTNAPRTLISLAALGAAGLMYVRRRIPREVPLLPALDAAPSFFDLPGFGRVAYYADSRGEGRPLVLVHSANAAASAHEMRPLFEHYRGRRPVYALDLPGFGLSDRPDVRYTPELMAQAVRVLLAHAGDGEDGRGADVVALSTGAEFAARAALMPLPGGCVCTLAMISPTGLGADDPSGEADTQRAHARYERLASPLWAGALFDVVASQASIRHFLARSFVGEPDEQLVRYAYATSHQPNARLAPLHFLAGLLFTCDAPGSLYSRLSMPTLILYDQDAFASFERLPGLLERHENVRAERIAPSRGMPHFERLPEVTAALDALWRSSEAGPDG